MALRGNLKDFSLPDVFQLVQLSGKTGVLRIAGDDAEGSIWFRDGDVFFAQSNWRRDQLGERLVHAQRITPAALSRALEIRAAEPEDGRRLGAILVDEGYITQQVLESFVQEQIQDTIFDLMRWDAGDFDFEVLPDVVHEDIGLAVSVENIVMEGSRRLEEWNRIKKKVPSTDMVFKMATAPGEGTFEISLKPVEWNLLLLIDGTRSVAELAHTTRRTDFEVARVIYGLFSAGLLEVPSDEEVERLRAERARREERRAAMEPARAEEQPSAVAAASASVVADEALTEADVEDEVPAATGPEAVPTAAAPSVSAEETPSETSVPAATESHEPHEEPEFLTAPGAAPSSDDMAMFEQMMGAVLAPQAETPSPSVTPTSGEASVPLEQEVAGFVPSAADFEIPVVPEPPEVVPAAELERGTTAESLPDLEMESAIADELLGFGAISAADLSEIPAPPVAETPVLDVGFVPTGDFEADLRTLGLGELPPELAESEVPAVPEPELDAEPETEPFTEVPLAGESLGDGMPLEAAREPMSTGESPVTPEDGTTLEADAIAESDSSGGAGGDLDDLIRSLDSEDVASAGVISSGTEYEDEDAGGGGVISTDAFLADFDDGDIGLSGGLGDELTALTGGGSVRARPQATVAKIPEPGEGVVLHRDRMVDRSLIEKIIEGIENL